MNYSENLIISNTTLGVPNDINITIIEKNTGLHLAHDT